MYVFEIISILINLFLGFVLLIKGNYLKKLIPTKAMNIILWVFLFIFGLNTIGNIFAESLFEKSLSLLTLIFTYLIWTIIKKNNPCKKRVLLTISGVLGIELKRKLLILFRLSNYYQFIFTSDAILVC